MMLPKIINCEAFGEVLFLETTLQNIKNGLKVILIRKKSLR